MFINRGRIVLESSMEELESRYVEVTARPEQLAAARALKPIQERQVLGRSIFLFDLKANQAERQWLTGLGDARAPGIADLFIAVISSQGAQAQAQGAAS